MPQIWFSSFSARESCFEKFVWLDQANRENLPTEPYSVTKTAPFTLLGIMQGVDIRGVVNLGDYSKILPTAHISDRKDLDKVNDIQLPPIWTEVKKKMVERDNWIKNK